MAEPVQGGGPPGRGQNERGAVMRERCLELRETGMTYAQIGTACGITRQSAFKHVMRAIEEIAKRSNERADKVRIMELRRLDALLRTHWPNRRDPKCSQIILEISKRRARLEGLDAPTQVEAFGKDGAPLNPPPAAAFPNLDGLSVEELRQFHELFKKAAAKPEPPKP